MTERKIFTREEVECPGGFLGKGPQENHVWSVANREGEQECLFCYARRQLKLYPVPEMTRDLGEPK